MEEAIKEAVWNILEKRCGVDFRQRPGGTGRNRCWGPDCKCPPGSCSTCTRTWSACWESLWGRKM